MGGAARNGSFQALQFAQPLSFTPYASARPCSARCRFCSETLIHEASSVRAAALRPGPGYFAGLRQVLAALHGVPLSWSLSGLETTDDPDWMLQLLAELKAGERDGPRIVDRVLYTNGAGFAGGRAEELLSALEAFGTSWIELSRHEADATRNDSIMRFRPGVAVAGADGFEAMVRRIRLPLKLVCIVQRGGIENAADVERYLAWAQGLGVRSVILREFSALPPGYRGNVTARYVESARVSMSGLLARCLALGIFERIDEKHGYYWWNTRTRHASGLEVVFEASDYARMHEHHDSGRVHKLVYFANGRLCAGWDPDRHVLMETGPGLQ